MKPAPGRPTAPAAFDRLLLAFANLRSYGIEAVIGEGSDAEEEMDRIGRELRADFPDSTGCCLVAMHDDLGCFTDEGHLVKPLLVHQRGHSVKTAARAALREFDLDVCEMDGESRLLVFDTRQDLRPADAESPLAGLEK